MDLSVPNEVVIDNDNIFSPQIIEEVPSRVLFTAEDENLEHVLPLCGGTRVVSSLESLVDTGEVPSPIYSLPSHS